MKDEDKAPYEIPVPNTLPEEGLSMKGKYVEGILRPPRSPKLDKEFEPKSVELRNGQKMVIREAKDSDIDLLMEGTKTMVDQEISTDFFDIVASRAYAELLAYKRKRMKDQYILIGVTEDGKIAGLVNARLRDEDVAISLHSQVFQRQVGAGTPLYFAKMEYAFEELGVEEWWPTFESHYGYKMGAMKTGAQQKPWPEYQHQLGGGRVFYNTKDQFENYIKPTHENLFGERPVSDELLETAEDPELPDIEAQFD